MQRAPPWGPKRASHAGAANARSRVTPRARPPSTCHPAFIRYAPGRGTGDAETTWSGRPVRGRTSGYGNEGATSIPSRRGPAARHAQRPHGQAGIRVLVEEVVAEAQVRVVRLAQHAHLDAVVAVGDVARHDHPKRVAHDLVGLPQIDAVVAAHGQVVGAEAIALMAQALD